jgi:hypothetical protein
VRHNRGWTLGTYRNPDQAARDVPFVVFSFTSPNRAKAAEIGDWSNSAQARELLSETGLRTT